MQSLREFLPSGFCDQMEKELGREQAFKLLWPAMVGSALAAQAKFVALRGNTLVVSVPERGWITSLATFERQILQAAMRFWGKPMAEKIEFISAENHQSLPQGGQ
jgi:predicted nucleic acid-binding Zn ribbon protein